MGLVQWVMIDPEGFETLKRELLSALEPMIGEPYEPGEPTAVVGDTFAKLAKTGRALPAFPLPREGGLTLDEIDQVAECIHALYGDQFNGFSSRDWSERIVAVAAEDKPDFRTQPERVIGDLAGLLEGEEGEP